MGTQIKILTSSANFGKMHQYAASSQGEHYLPLKTHLEICDDLQIVKNTLGVHKITQVNSVDHEP